MYVDKDAPTCNGFTGESSTWTNSNRTIRGSASDSGSGTSSSFSKTYNSGTTKTAEVSFEAKDNVGNTRTCKKTVNVYVDKEGPKLSNLKNDSKGNWTNKDFNVSYSVTDSGVGYDHCEYNYDYDRFNSCGGSSWCVDTGTHSNGTFTTSFSAERNTTAHFKCYDKLGNASNVISTTIKIDKTAPKADHRFEGSTIIATCTDYVSYSNTEYGSGTSTSSYLDYDWEKHYFTNMYNGNAIDVSMGSATSMHLYCYDNAGNSSSETDVTVPIPTPDPEPSIEPPSCSISTFTRYLAKATCSNTSKARYLRIRNTGAVDFDIDGVETMYGDDNNNVNIDSKWDAGNILGFCIEATSPQGATAVFCTTRQASEDSSEVTNCHYDYSAPSGCIDGCDDNGYCDWSDHTPTACSATLVCS